MTNKKVYIRLFLLKEMVKGYTQDNKTMSIGESQGATIVEITGGRRYAIACPDEVYRIGRELPVDKEGDFSACEVFQLHPVRNEKTLEIIFEKLDKDFMAIPEEAFTE